jgi:aldose sugar dehydrogenase
MRHGLSGSPFPAPAAIAIGAVLLACLTACSNGPAAASASSDATGSRSERFRVVTVVDGLAHPWGMAFLPGGDILVTERPGRLRLVRNGKLQREPVGGVPEVWARGQGGLLDVALHPAFATNRLVYLSYSKPGPRGATTAVARGRFEDGRLTAVEDIFVADAWSENRIHFGSRLVFDRDGLLFVTVGDRGDDTGLGTRQRAQNLGDHAGSTLRLHDDGRVPDDNPFVGREGARPEIWSYGHRNAQGMTLHPETGAIWQHEHGPRGGDEVNVIRRGANYGWPVVTHGINYIGTKISDQREGAGIEKSLLVWVPSIAPSGMAFYAMLEPLDYEAVGLISGLEVPPAAADEAQALLPLPARPLHRDARRRGAAAHAPDALRAGASTTARR